MKKVTCVFQSNMKNSFFLLLCYSFAAFTVLKSGVVWGEEISDLSTWDALSDTDLISVNVVSKKFSRIFSNARSSTEKVISTLKDNLENGDADIAASKIQTSLSEISEILKYINVPVSNYYYRVGNHYVRRLKTCIRFGKLKQFKNIDEIEATYNTDINSQDDLVVMSNELFNSSYNPKPILEKAVEDLLTPDAYSSKSVSNDIDQLSKTTSAEIDRLEGYAIKILNQMYKGIEIAKETKNSLRRNRYPEEWSKEYIITNLQKSMSLAKALMSGCTKGAGDDKSGEDLEDKSDNKDSGMDTRTANPDLNGSSSVEIESNMAASNVSDSNNCDTTFKITEKNILRQLILGLKDIKSMEIRTKIDSRIYKVFKHFSAVLSDLHQKLITDMVSLINQFMQLYNIILMILDKINPEMKVKVSDVYYNMDVNNSDENIENIKKYFVGSYLYKEKMNELYQQIKDNHQEDEELEKFKNAIVSELSAATNDIGVELKSMKSTTIYIFLQIKCGVEALQTLKNRSNNRGLRYYINFYTGKADIAVLKRVMSIINVLDINHLVEKQIEDTKIIIIDFKKVTKSVRKEVNEKNENIATQISELTKNEATDIVSESAEEYNSILESYSMEAKKKLKIIITKFVTISEEMVIIVKRKRTKHGETIEEILNDDSLTLDSKNEIISKYLLENSEIDIRTDCKTIAKESNVKVTKDVAVKEVQELNTVVNSEISKIDKTVLDIMDKLISATSSLNNIKNQISTNENYQLTEEEVNNISNAVKLINALNMKSNVGVVEGLNVYLEKIKAKIDSAKEDFISGVTECKDNTEIGVQIENTNKVLHTILSNTSVVLTRRIKEYTSQYTNKLSELLKKIQNKELSSINESSTGTYNFNVSYSFEKYISHYYDMETTFFNHDEKSASTDIAEVQKTISSELENKTKSINSEINTIQSEISSIINKITESLNTIEELQINHSQQIDESKITLIKETKTMVDVLNKYLNTNYKNAEAIDVMFHTALSKISTENEKVCKNIESSADQSSIQTFMDASITNYENIYSDLKSKVSQKMDEDVAQVINEFQETVANLKQMTKDSKTVNTLQEILTGHVDYQGTTDVEYNKVCKYLSSSSFTSMTVHSLYDEIRGQTTSKSTEEKKTTIQLMKTLSEKLKQNICDLDSARKYILTNMRSGNHLLQAVNKAVKQNAKYELNESEISELKKIMMIKQSLKSTTSKNSIIDTSIKKAENQITQTSEKAIEKLKTLKEENSIREVEESTKNTIKSISDEVYKNVYNEISKTSQQLVSTFEKTISSIQQEEIRTTLSNIRSNKHAYTSTSDKEFNRFTLNIDNYSSSTSIESTKKFAKPDNTLNVSSEVETAIRTFASSSTTSVRELGEIAKYSILNSQKGIQILNDLCNLAKSDKNYKLTNEQVSQLQKCSTILQVTENISNSNLEKSIISTIFNAKTEINSVCLEAVNSMRSLSDTNNLIKLTTETANKIQTIYSKSNENLKKQVQNIVSSLTSNYHGILSNSEILKNRQLTQVLTDILNRKNAYNSKTDEKFLSFRKRISESNFFTSASLEDWYYGKKESVFASSSISSEQTISLINNLKDEATKLLENSSEIGVYIATNIKSTSAVLNQISTIARGNADYQLTEEQITQLQKTISITQVTQDICNETSSKMNSVIDSKRNEISKICDEVITSIKSLNSDKEIEDTVSQKIKIIETAYTEARSTMQKEILNSFESYKSEMQQTISNVKEINSEYSSVLENIINESSVYKSETDSEFNSLSRYINSNSFQSSIVVQNWYTNIQQNYSNSNSVTVKELSMNCISNLKEKINSEMKSMKEEGKYILRNVMQGTEILHNINNSKKQLSEYVTNDITTQLQKTTSVMQMIKNINSECITTYTNQKDLVSMSIISAQSKIHAECKKATQYINSATQVEQNNINKAILRSVDNIETTYDNVVNTLQNSVKNSSQQFANNFQESITRIEKQENAQLRTVLQDIAARKNTDVLQTNEKFNKFKAYVNSVNFQSSSVVQNWYSSIQKTESTELTVVKENAITSINNLRHKVTNEFRVVSQIGDYILSNLQESSKIIQQINSIKKENTNFQLTEMQITQLQTSVEISHVMKNIYEGSSSSLYENSQNTISSTMKSAQKEVDNICAVTTKSLDSINKLDSLKQTISTNVNQIGSICAKSKSKVQSQITQLSEKFVNNFQKSVATIKTTKVDTSAILSDIISRKSTYVTEKDTEYQEFQTFIKNVNFDSYNMIRNWRTNCETTTSTSITSAKELFSKVQMEANQDISKMEKMGSYIANNLSKGSSLIQKIRDTTENYQLTQEEITLLQKCVSITQVIQNTYTTNEITIESEKSFLKDVNIAKTDINNSCNKVINSVRSLKDEHSISQIVSTHLDEVQTVYDKVKSNLETHVAQTSNNFFSSLWQSSSEIQKYGSAETNAVFQDILTGKNVNTAEYGEEFSKLEQYASGINLQTDVHNLYTSITSQGITSAIGQSINEVTVSNVNNLKSKLENNFSNMQSVEHYVITELQESSKFLKAISSSVKEDSTFQLTQNQKLYLQKSLAIIQIVQNICIQKSSSSVTSLSVDIKKTEEAINTSCTKAIESIKSIKDKASINKIVSNNVREVENAYNEAKTNIQSSVTKSATNFISTYQETISKLKENVELNKTLQTILKENDLRQYVSDEKYNKFESYIKSGTFKTTTVVQTLYEKTKKTINLKKISNVNERCTTIVENLKNNVREDLQNMQSVGNYAITNLEKGSKFINNIYTEVKRNSAYKLTEEQKTELRKYVSIAQTIQNVSINEGLSSGIGKITSNINTAREEISDICSKVTQTIESMKTKEEIRQEITKSVTNVETSFTKARDNMESCVKESSSNFLDSVKQVIDSKGQLSTVLQDVLNNENSYKTVTSEEFNKFQTFIKSANLQSKSVVQKWYSDIEKSSTVTEENIKQQTINNINSFKNIVDQHMENMSSVSEYISKHIEQGSTLIKQITSSDSVKLTEEQVSELKISVLITKTVQEVFTTSTTAIEQSKGTLVDIVAAKDHISGMCSNLIDSIKSGTDKDNIHKIVIGEVNKIGSSYIDTRDQVKNNMLQQSSGFYDNFQKTVTQYKQSENTEVHKTLENILNSRKSLDSDIELTNFKKYVTSSNFTTSVQINNWNRLIHQSVSNVNQIDTETVTNTINNVKTDLEGSMKNMDTANKYVNDYLAKGSVILQEISTTSVTTITTEQTIILQKCFMIHDILTNISNTSKNVTNEKSVISNIVSNLEATSSISQNTINEEYSKAVQSIISVNDEKEVKQIANNCVDKIETTYNKVKQESHEGMKQVSSTFHDQYSNAISSISDKNNELGKRLSDVLDKTNTIELVKDEELRKCVTFIKSTTYQSTTVVHEVYTKLETTTIVDSTTSSNEVAVNQLKQLNEKVNNDIKSISQNTKYFTSTLKEGYEIIENIKNSSEQNISFHVSQEQVVKLQKCVVLMNAVEEVNTTNSVTDNKSTVTPEKLVNEDTTSSATTGLLSSDTQISKKDATADVAADNVAKGTTNDYREIPSNSATSIPSNGATVGNNAPVVPRTLSNDNGSSHAVQPKPSNVSFIPAYHLVSPISNNTSPGVPSLADTNESKPRILTLNNFKGNEISSPTLNNAGPVVPVLPNMTPNNANKESPSDNQVTNETKTVVKSSQQKSSSKSTSERMESKVTGNSIGPNSDSVSNIQTKESTDVDVQHVTNVEKNIKKSVVIVDADSEESPNDADVTVYKKQSISEKTEVKKVEEKSTVQSTTSTVAEKPMVSTEKSNSEKSEVKKVEKKSAVQSTSSNLAEKPVFPNEKLDDSSLKGLLVRWDVEESTSKVWPSTCKSLTWSKNTYYISNSDKETIKKVAGFLKVGRKILFDLIAIAKENLNLFVNVEDFQTVIGTCTEKVDKLLHQLSSAIVANLRPLTLSYTKNLNQNLPNSKKMQLTRNACTLDDDFVSSAKAFYGLQYKVTSQLLGQINKELGEDNGDTVDEADIIAINKLKRLESMVRIIINNVDCLVLRTVDTVMNGKVNIENLKKGSTDVNWYRLVKNAEVMSNIINQIKY